MTYLTSPSITLQTNLTPLSFTDQFNPILHYVTEQLNLTIHYVTDQFNHTLHYRPILPQPIFGGGGLPKKEWCGDEVITQMDSIRQ